MVQQRANPEDREATRLTGIPLVRPKDWTTTLKRAEFIARHPQAARRFDLHEADAARQLVIATLGGMYRETRDIDSIVAFVLASLSRRTGGSSTLFGKAWRLCMPVPTTRGARRAAAIEADVLRILADAVETKRMPSVLITCHVETCPHIDEDTREQYRGRPAAKAAA